MSGSQAVRAPYNPDAETEGSPLADSWARDMREFRRLFPDYALTEAEEHALFFARASERRHLEALARIEHYGAWGPIKGIIFSAVVGVLLWWIAQRVASS